MYLTRRTTGDLLCIRPRAASGSIFGFSAPRIVARLKAAAKGAGLGDRGFTGHSPRVGAAQDLAAAGASLVEMQIAGRWSSPGMPARYAAAVNCGRSAVAKYFEEQPEAAPRP